MNTIKYKDELKYLDFVYIFLCNIYSETIKKFTIQINCIRKCFYIQNNQMPFINYIFLFQFGY